MNRMMNGMTVKLGTALVGLLAAGTMAMADHHAGLGSPRGRALEKSLRKVSVPTGERLNREVVTGSPRADATAHKVVRHDDVDKLPRVVSVWSARGLNTFGR